MIKRSCGSATPGSTTLSPLATSPSCAQGVARAIVQRGASRPTGLCGHSSARSVTRLAAPSETCRSTRSHTPASTPCPASSVARPLHAGSLSARTGKSIWPQGHTQLVPRGASVPYVGVTWPTPAPYATTCAAHVGNALSSASTAASSSPWPLSCGAVRNLTQLASPASASSVAWATPFPRALCTLWETTLRNTNLLMAWVLRPVSKAELLITASNHCIDTYQSQGRS